MTAIGRSSWVITLTLTAAAVAYVVFGFLPSRRVIGELRGQVVQKQNYVAQSDDLAKALKATAAELQKTQAYNTAWKKRAPAEQERSGLYGQINALAKTAATVTTRFDPKPPSAHAHIRELPLVMGCTGTFAQTHELLRSLESLPVAIWVDSVLMKRTGENGDSVASEINLVVFTNNPDNSN